MTNHDTIVQRLSEKRLVVGNYILISYPWGDDPESKIRDAHRRYLAGESMVKIARDCKVSGQTLRNIFAELGPLRKRGGWQQSRRQTPSRKWAASAVRTRKMNRKGAAL